MAGSSENEWRERTRRQQAAILRIVTSPQFCQGQLGPAQRLLTEVAAAALEVERCSVWFLEDDGQVLRCVDLFEVSREHHSCATTLTAADYPRYFEALKTGRAIDAGDAINDARTSEFAVGYLDDLHISSMLDGAIRVQGEVVGVVCFEHVDIRRKWTPDEISFAGEVADQIANLSLAAQNSEHIAARQELWSRLGQSERQRMIGTLAAGMAHDFNNILTPVLAHAELAQLATEPDHPVQEHLIPIVKAGVRARDLIRQLFALGRPLDRPALRADVCATTADTLSLARASIPSNIEMQNITSIESLWVEIEPTQLQQILLNLIVNGAHSMKAAGGVLRVEQALESDGPNKGYARIRVADQGHGMDEETMASIFEPFYTTKPIGEGSGLGLAVVRGILAGAGGRIEVDSSKEGTVFDVFLPLAEALEEPSSIITPPTEEARRLRILLVDDELVVADVLRAQLEHLGHSVTVSHSGHQAWEKFAADANNFDLVISDYTMADSNGAELLKRIRKLRSDVSTILMSGLGHDGQEHDPYVDVFLMKPFRAARLREAVRIASPG